MIWALGPAAEASEEKEEISARWDFIRQTFELKSGKIYLRGHRKLSVFNPRGDEFAQLVFGQTPFEKIKKLSIEFKSSDKTASKTSELKDLKKLCGFGPDYTVYSDICYFVYTATAPSHPYSIEVFEEIEYANAFIFNGSSFSTKIPISSLVCSLICQPQTPVRFKSYALPLQFEDFFDKGKRTLVWSGEEIEPPDFDTLSALDYELAGVLSIVIDEFSFINSDYRGGTWADIGRWYVELLRKRYSWEGPTPAGSSETPLFDVCQEAYDNIIKDFRYVAVSIGVSGWQPRLIDDITKTKYGDCKDLSMLLINELREKNIEAYPALVLTRGEGLIDSLFPSFRFNHLVAVAISGSDSLWMDPTCRNCPIGQIPWADQHNQALLVTDTGGILVPTPRSIAASNVVIHDARTILKPDRRLYTDLRVDFIGQRGSSFRERLSHTTSQEQLQIIESYLENKSITYKVNDFSVENLNNFYDTLRIRISAVTTNPIRKVGQILYIDPCLVEPSLNMSSTDYDRARPLKFYFPNILIDSVHFSIDPAMVIDSVVLPPFKDYRSEIGSWQIFSEKHSASPDGVFQLTLRRSLDEIFVLPDKFDALKEFESELTNRESRLVKVFLKSN